MMFDRKKIIAVSAFFILIVSFGASAANAQGNEFDAVCDQFEKKYKAKKVKIPFMWLARLAVGIVRPAGVKSFKVITYTDLKIAPEALDQELSGLMRDSFSEDWGPILRIRSKSGEQIYMNMRESGKSVKIFIVTVSDQKATVVRAKFDPEKLADFIEDPKIFGFSLDGNQTAASAELEESGVRKNGEIETERERN